MPFGLKNIGATYQEAMNTIFYEHVRKTVECYIDDNAVKSWAKGDHIADLKTVFDIMWAHPIEDEPRQIPPRGSQWQVPWICNDIQRNLSRQRESLRDLGDATSKKS